MQKKSSNKVNFNTISSGELSDPLCDSVNWGLTLVRFRFEETWIPFTCGTDNDRFVNIKLILKKTYFEIT